MKRIIAATGIVISSLLTANGQEGIWNGKLDIQGRKLSVVFHLDREQPTMDSPNQGVKGIAIKVEKGIMGKITIKAPTIGMTYEGMWLNDRIIGTFEQFNQEFPLTLTPGPVRLLRPQTPIGPFPYSTEEVSFRNGEYVFNGTLTVPEKYTRNTPVLLMITGSGQQNRDEELFDHKPFAVIADALARAGYASLRYDDRGYGSKELNPLEWTMEDFKTDACAGIDFLKARFETIGVIGHSEGGTIAMMLAAEDKVDFIVSLAGMTVSGAETLVEQNRTALLGAGISEETVDSYCKLINEAFNIRMNGGYMPDPEQFNIPEYLMRNYYAVVSLIQTPYMKNFLKMDIRPIIGNISCPILALNGTKDIQVNNKTNLNVLRDAIKLNKLNIIEEIEGVNHLFQHCTSGAITEYGEIEETFSPEVLEMIIKWLKALDY